MSVITEIQTIKIQVGEHEQRLAITDEEIAGMVVSIGRVGVLVPLIIRRQDDGIFLVSGHRRLAAAKKANLKTVPCIERGGDSVSDGEVVFAENYFRKDLSPVELAAALKDVRERGEIGLAELAAGFHRSEHWVVRMIAIADWPADVQKAVHCDGLSVSAASNLALVTDDSYRVFLVRNAIDGGATARTTASWLQAWRAMQPQEEAITSEPVPGTAPVAPLVPQAPCLCCSQLFEVNMMSHVPVCGGCVQIIRSIGQTQV